MKFLFDFLDCLYRLFLNVGFWRPFCIVFISLIAGLFFVMLGFVWFFDHDYKGKHEKDGAV